MNEPSILVADDSANDVFFLKTQLKTAGLTNALHVVTNGEEAIRYLAGEGVYSDRERHPFPALLLLDLKMPRKTGFDVLEWIKANNIGLPVIVLSALGEVHHMSRVYQLGARGFLMKPVAFKQFSTALRNVKELVVTEHDAKFTVEPKPLEPVAPGVLT